jgi:carbon storage regulator
MLVIRRRAGESVRLGGGIEVTVLEISSNRVKLGFVAPAEVEVVRGEMEAARRQNREAAAGAPEMEELTRLARSLRRGVGRSEESSSRPGGAGR